MIIFFCTRKGQNLFILENSKIIDLELLNSYASGQNKYIRTLLKKRKKQEGDTRVQ